MRHVRKTILLLSLALMAIVPGLAGGRTYAGPPMATIYVSRIAIYPGDTITEDMLGTKSIVQTSNMTTYVTQPQMAVGKVAKHVIVPGQPIARVSLREPYVVQQNKLTPVFFQSEGLTITGYAVALESGSVGDMIMARNQETGLIIKGQVQSDGALKVDAE